MEKLMKIEITSNNSYYLQDNKTDHQIKIGYFEKVLDETNSESQIGKAPELNQVEETPRVRVLNRLIMKIQKI